MMKKLSRRQRVHAAHARQEEEPYPSPRVLRAVSLRNRETYPTYLGPGWGGMRMDFFVSRRPHITVVFTLHGSVASFSLAQRK